MQTWAPLACKTACTAPLLLTWTLAWTLTNLYQTISPGIRLLLKVLKDIAYRWLIFTAYDGLGGKTWAPPVLNRMFCTSQEPFQIRVAPVSVPPGKAAHLRTGTQEHNQPTAEIQHRYVAHQGSFIFLYSTYSRNAGNTLHRLHTDTGKEFNWVEFCVSSNLAHGKVMKRIHLSKYSVLTHDPWSRCASKHASGT